jgi:hypothetical protein
MRTGTILFVHGTGARLRSQQSLPEYLKTRASQFNIGLNIENCVWGDPVGAEFSGKSLPDLPEANEHELQRDREWLYYDADPLFGLRLIALPAYSQPKSSLQAPPRWELAWERIRVYTPSGDLEALLKRAGVAAQWPAAWGEIAGDPLVKKAFRASGENIADPARALAEGIVARLLALSDLQVSRAMREKLLDRLRADWQADVRGIGKFVSEFLAGAATRWVRSRRGDWSNAASLIVGDILLYQSRGEQVRGFLAERIAACASPVVLLAHSLGGVACVDLMALPSAPSTVQKLITVGSQGPLFHEFGALVSLKEGADLPSGFPPWMNFFDRNDFLSYIGNRIFTRVRDVEIRSGLPFPQSHSAYFACDETWIEIKRFLEDA